ncbi:FMN oxidoreductase [Geomicrobium sp. JCM 19055]|nr:FMN oxidoreductase [Geomicrobium sp. JCM 19055]
MTKTVGHVLLEEVAMKNVQLQSRIVMAPMTRVFSPDGVPNDEVAAYYRKRAEGGVGLIVTEARPLIILQQLCIKIFQDFMVKNH